MQAALCKEALMLHLSSSVSLYSPHMLQEPSSQERSTLKSPAVQVLLACMLLHEFPDLLARQRLVVAGRQGLDEGIVSFHIALKHRLDFPVGVVQQPAHFHVHCMQRVIRHLHSNHSTVITQISATRAAW